MSTRPLVAIFGLDSVRPKLLYQTRWLQPRGFDVDVLAVHRNEASIREDWSCRIEQLRPSAFGRLRQVVGYLRRERSRLHHAEVYIGGRFASVYVLACRLTRVPVIVVERGDLMYYASRTHPWLTRRSMYLSYRFSNRIWFKEPYMAEPLRRWGFAEKSFMLPNGVPLPPRPTAPRDIDFLWVNRLLPERHPDWFVSALEALDGSGPELRCDVLGFSRDGLDPENVTEMESIVRPRIDRLSWCGAHPFGDPAPYFERARFFVLPADIVFGNYALLEAMAHGVVPIVSRTLGADDIVDDDENGFLVDHGPDALLGVMKRAAEMPSAEWERLSRAARSTIEHRFSVDVWGAALLEAYRGVHEPNAPQVWMPESGPRS